MKPQDCEIGFENDLYEVLIEEDFNLTNMIRIKKTPFDGVVFRVGAIHPVEVGGQLQINYRYEIIDPAGNSMVSLEENEEYKRLMSQIVQGMLNNYIAWLGSRKGNADA